MRGLSRYWVFQLVGWGLFALINIFFAFVFDRPVGRMIYRLAFFVEMGIICSHFMRETARRYRLLMRPIGQQIAWFLILTLVFGLLFSLAQTAFERYYGVSSIARNEAPFHVLFFYNLSSAFVLLFIWNCIYFMYHYIEKSRRQQLDTVKLEALVKELELKTIKAHINPHFIFNSLNSIRALIDEDPQRARRAVTELSNILRSSLSAEKGETVAFRDELKIVRDYLNLEHMRFEDRLVVDYEVEDETLEMQVPPMMLQILVENAIKHGISKQLRGGVVRICSRFQGPFHKLTVQNTGHLNGARRDGGFGLASTQDRLQLLYGNKARFDIRQLQPDLVEAQVLLPLSLN